MAESKADELRRLAQARDATPDPHFNDVVKAIREDENSL